MEAINRSRIYSHLTRSRFLHFEDSLERGKIRIFAGEFTKGQGMKGSAFHFLDLDDARVIFSDLAWGRPCEHVDYKGGLAADGSGKVVSRVLKAKIDLTQDRAWISVRNGPGEKIGQGVVKSKGEADAEINIGMEIRDARKLGFAVLAYLQAWDVARMIRRLETGD